MKVLVLGSNGATGFNVVTQLLKHGINVKAVTRNLDKFEQLKDNRKIEIIHAGILDIDNKKLEEYLSDTDAVISCLEHNITLKGIFGRPRTLVVDALVKVVNAADAVAGKRTIKVILMNTTACVNRSQGEKFKGKEKFIMSVLSRLLPPQRDNELALEFLLEKTGTGNKHIEWVAVRPDGLADEDDVSEYTVHPSPVRSPIFNPGKTDRINVADFMVSLLKNRELWEKWKFRTPVIYNREPMPDKNP